MGETFGDQFLRVRGALDNLSRTTYLSIRWGEYKVYLNGINKLFPSRRAYEVEVGFDPLPEGVYVVKNEWNAVLLGGDEPAIPPFPIRGYQTLWCGGIPVPWLTQTLTQRIYQLTGLRVDHRLPVWASRWTVVGRHHGEPVRVLASSDNTPVAIPAEATPVTLDLPVEYGIWQVPADAADPRIPEWDGALGGLWRGKVESVGEEIIPSPTVGIALPLPWTKWGAAVKMTRGGWVTFLSDNGPVYFEIQDMWPEFVWVVVTQI